VAAILAFRTLFITFHHWAGRHAGNKGQNLMSAFNDNIFTC